MPTMLRKAFKHYFVRAQFSTLGYVVSFGFFLLGPDLKEKDRQAHVPFLSFLDLFWRHGRCFPLVCPDLAVREFSRRHLFGLCARMSNEEKPS
jgi:hypothetical protein